MSFYGPKDGKASSMSYAVATTGGGSSASGGGGIGSYKTDGISLRDYLACHASDHDVSMTITEYYEENYTREDYCPITRQQARYIFADAMLEARRK